jgi:hypothetical protein
MRRILPKNASAEKLLRSNQSLVPKEFAISGQDFAILHGRAKAVALLAQRGRPVMIETSDDWSSRSVGPAKKQRKERGRSFEVRLATAL